MLRTRVITALVIAIVVLFLLFALSGSAFAVLSALVLLGLGGWEAGRLAGLQRSVASGCFATLLLVLGLMLGSLVGLISAPTAALPTLDVTTPQLLWGPALLWLILLTWLIQPGLGAQAGAAWRTVKLLVLSIILLAAWLAIAWLQARSPWWVVLLIIIVAAADVGAYFTGRAIGGPKLAPRISPGKTWSGVVGGLIATMLISGLAVIYLPDAPFSPVIAGAIALVLAAISVGGDLFMSLLKRQRGLKDSSQLLPGHGGILDRIDSVGAALPFFALAVAYLIA